jgi:hypothetical protein
MRLKADSRMYPYGETILLGVTPDNVIAVKINAVSSDKLFRRAKDLIDLYALAHCLTVKTADICRIWERKSLAIGTFEEFRNRLNDLRHSYEKLSRVDPKPEFDKIYYYLTQFLRPFIEENSAPLVWDRAKTSWSCDICDLSTSEPHTPFRMR